jgi:hypothetical protein
MKPGPSADWYRQAVKKLLEDGEDKLVLSVFARLRQKEDNGTLEDDEVMRLAVLKELAQ